MPPPDEEDPDLAEEARLFRAAVRGVRPLARRRRQCHPSRACGRARASRAQTVWRCCARAWSPPSLTDPDIAAGDELVYHRPEVPRLVLRRLRRGDYRVQRELDLHGLTVVEAKQVLRDFLADALEHDVRCVRIIHGKGLRSGHRGPVLKSAVGGRAPGAPGRCSPSSRRARSMAAPVRSTCCCPVPERSPQASAACPLSPISSRKDRRGIAAAAQAEAQHGRIVLRRCASSCTARRRLRRSCSMCAPVHRAHSCGMPAGGRDLKLLHRA